MTYNGHQNEYSVLNYSNENFMPYLMDGSLDDLTISSYVSVLSSTIKGQLS